MFGEFHRCKGPMRATKIEPIYVSSCSTPVYICARSLWGSRNANFGDSILSILQQSRKEELVSCKAISQLKKGIALRKSSTNRLIFHRFICTVFYRRSIRFLYLLGLAHLRYSLNDVYINILKWSLCSKINKG
jgi:hypothetical protein